MPKKLPSSPDAILHWTWPEVEPHYRELESRSLSAANLDAWMADWSRLSSVLEEMNFRLVLATSVDTADREAEARLKRYYDTVYPGSLAGEQRLKAKLLASGLEPKGFEIPLRNLRAEADLFREANLPLLAEEQKLALEYDKIFGAQTVKWEGQELTLTRLAMVFQEADRTRREKAWRLKAERQLADRQAVDDLWRKFMDVRARIAKNAGKPSFREFVWQQKQRFDYTPEDCKSFQRAIEQVVVPAATRVYEKHRRLLGLDRLRPWDLTDGWYAHAIPDPKEAPLKPFRSTDELKAGVKTIFNRVDPALGGYFEAMLKEGLTDLENRKNKAPGAFCVSFTSIRRPFIFLNAVGVHDDVVTCLHESGHGFHVFEMAGLPYFQQLNIPMEFAEVASLGMELLASPYLTKKDGGFYTESEAARARIEHLEREILFWPFMAVVDAFQQWVYENPAGGSDPRQCDAKWSELWERFIPGVDWSGMEEVKATGWHRKLHIHKLPFYYVEYGLAQLGAVQIFGNARQDQAAAVAAYRKALALGGTAALPELFRAAGARFAFDAGILEQAVGLLEGTIRELEKKL